MKKAYKPAIYWAVSLFLSGFLAMLIFWLIWWGKFPTINQRCMATRWFCHFGCFAWSPSEEVLRCEASPRV